MLEDGKEGSWFNGLKALTRSVKVTKLRRLFLWRLCKIVSGYKVPYWRPTVGVNFKWYEIQWLLNSSSSFWKRMEGNFWLSGRCP